MHFFVSLLILISCHNVVSALGHYYSDLLPENLFIVRQTPNKGSNIGIFTSLEDRLKFSHSTRESIEQILSGHQTAIGIAKFITFQPKRPEVCYRVCEKTVTKSLNFAAKNFMNFYYEQYFGSDLYFVSEIIHGYKVIVCMSSINESALTLTLEDIKHLLQLDTAYISESSWREIPGDSKNSTVNLKELKISLFTDEDHSELYGSIGLNAVKAFLGSVPDLLANKEGGIGWPLTHRLEFVSDIPTLVKEAQETNVDSTSNPPSPIASIRHEL